MAAVVAHEVRNPLAGIRAAVQVITRRLLPEAPSRRSPTKSSRESTLNDIVGDLLQFARRVNHRP
jgi:nitrogen-specific signal transduction histidine kinase